ncbi:Spy/CpxP family protein refolding chaperone [Labrys monachus]|uniref:LTXXQ motif family protein n=1 Tax=Labrys monachus TaxID=217067 RepID=A0ABU0FJT0_9HYPH|nr:Spy/CpxP family protein refolding chaperone [Labrys monachus]MDQ0394867.1 hypothetical protein [Labrys monachus]
MSIIRRFSIPALLLASAVAAWPAAVVAQTMPSPGQSDEEHDTGRPGPCAAGPLADSPSGGMPGTMMGKGQARMMNGDMMQMMSMMRGMMTMMSAESGMMSSHVEGRIASLRSDLGITGAQSPLWDRFAEALRATAKSMNGMYGQMMHAKGASTLPARLEAQKGMLSAHLAAIAALKDALDPLYASFSDEQKRRADGLMIGPMGMM